MVEYKLSSYTKIADSMPLEYYCGFYTSIMDDDNSLIYWYLNGVKLIENRQEINSERTHIASKDTIKLHMYYILVHLNITDLALMDLEQNTDFEV